MSPRSSSVGARSLRSMRLTHLGHACLLVETGGQRVLIDPGVFSPGFVDVTGLDVILVTHQHPDHLDLQRLPAMLEANPQARLYAEPQAAAVMAEAGVASEHTMAGQVLTIGRVQITPVGEKHALINEALPRIGNLGLVLRSESEPSLFHPGDAYDGEPGQIDILALPLNAPWDGQSRHRGFRPADLAAGQCSDPRHAAQRDRPPALSVPRAELRADGHGGARPL